MKKLVFIFMLCAFLPYQVSAQSILKKLESDLRNIPSGYKSATKRYELITKAINSLNYLTKTCGKEKQYKELLELAPNIRGAATSQHIGEINALALIKCPEGYLSALLSANGPDVSASVGVMGITIPPWETAEVIYPYLEVPIYKDLMDQYFRKWVVSCTNEYGKAQIGCNYANN